MTTGRPPTGRNVRVLIVDDSMIVRTVLSRTVSGEDDLEVVGLAANAENALSLLATVTPDVILLDLEMPGMGGMEALPKILKAVPDARILVVSSLTVDGAEHVVEALSQGASDTFPKPVSGNFNIAYRTMLLDKIRGLGGGRWRTAPVAPRSLRPARPLRKHHGKPIAALAIGASTGGIHALGLFFGALPSRLGIPIFITQHLPNTFMHVFACQMALVSGREAVVAEDEMVVCPDQIVIAPGDAHIALDFSAGHFTVRLDRARATSGCMPSVDPMFASLAACDDGNVLGVVLSGMGRDGAEGAACIVEAGGLVYAQDEGSSSVWGMPRAVVEAGLAAAILPPDQLARRIAAHVDMSAWK